MEQAVDGNEEQFVQDFKLLFKEDTRGEYEVQWEIIKNLVGKIKSRRNHHFEGLIKKYLKDA